jgi:hypothetical protein
MIMELPLTWQTGNLSFWQPISADHQFVADPLQSPSHPEPCEVVKRPRFDAASF